MDLKDRWRKDKITLNVVKKAKTGERKTPSTKSGNARMAKSYTEMRKFNPYHDSLGRFSSANGAASFTFAPGKSKAHDKAIQREREKAPKMSLNEYLGSQGLSSPISDFMDDKLRIPHGLTRRQTEQLRRDADKARNEYSAKREKAIAEYKEKVKNGEIREKSRIEQLIDMANGHPDNQATQAARRALDKRGVNWKNVAKSYSSLRKFNPYHDSRGRFTSRNAHTLFSPGNNPTQAKRSIDAENKRRAAEGMDQLVSGAYMTMGRVAYGSALKAYLDEQAKKKDPIQQTAAPYKAGKSVKWGNMSDDEFVRDLEKYMPGINDIATKGWAASHSASQYKDSSLNGDMVLTDIYKTRGFNAMPQMMDKASIKSYIAQNKTPELYRGMGTSSHGQSGAEKMDRFEKDPLHFAGYGVLGNGTYAAETPPNSYRNYGLRVARSYAGRNGGGTQVRMTLKKDAKVAAYTTVRRQQREFLSKLGQAFYSGTIGFDTYKALNNICVDVGRFGALRGYEAWYDKTGAHSGATRNSPFWVITNRGALIIQNERYT